jgi:predicted ATP-grasp superfamily ATP-dependent carboligase
MSGRRRVLITNGEERSMLATCRGLRLAGYDVTVAASTVFAPAQWSRSCARRLRITDASVDAERFVEQLREELSRNPHAALIAGSDSSLLAVSRGREQLGELTELGLPAPSILERALSRESLAEAAGQAGLIPAVSIRCGGVEEARAAAEELGYPVVVKSTDAAAVRQRGVVGGRKGQIVSNDAVLAETVRAFGAAVLVQRWAGDDVVSFGGVIGGGELLGVAVSRYRRTWPPDGGSVAYGETIAVPEQLAEKVKVLLGAIGWEGIFELELIQSAPGEFVPIDLNPRPYGSMALAAAAGAPLAALWCDWLLGGHPEPARARPGCSYRWEDGDLMHLAWQLRRGHYKAAMAPLRPHRNVTHAHFTSADPLPLLARGVLTSMLVLRLSKRLGRRRRRVGQSEATAAGFRGRSKVA